VLTWRLVRGRPGPLLCELHAHTRWSDGALSIAELVDLYGRNGFDVLCVTDHVVRRDDPWRELEEWIEPALHEESWPAYVAEIEREAERARAMFGMLVVPGLELTYNDADPAQAAHAVALGLRSFVSLDDGIEEAIRTAIAAGAAIIAAHPFDCSPGNGVGTGLKSGPDAVSSRLTQRFARDEALRGLAHRFELFNRKQLFGWVADAGLAAVATGDFHRLEHLPGWKTLVPGLRDEAALVEYLRSPRPVYLTRVEADESLLAA
jgi:predicted metal-dependent phosphoesterase TrpH